MPERDLDWCLTQDGVIAFESNNGGTWFVVPETHDVSVSVVTDGGTTIAVGRTSCEHWLRKNRAHNFRPCRLTAEEVGSDESAEVPYASNAMASRH
jgi:hypothetical protein